MDEATAFATKAELEQVKKEQKRMAIQLEVNCRALEGLTKEVAHLSERTERIEAKVDALEAKVDALDAKMDRRFDTLTAVILSLGKNG